MELTMKILFDSRVEGRRFLALSKKHRLLKKYFNSWDKKIIVFSFENTEQKEVMSDVIKGLLSNFKIGYTIID